MSVIEGIALAEKALPGPLKYKADNYLKFCRPKTPTMVQMKRTSGRPDPKKHPKSANRLVGPASYNTNDAFKKFNTIRSRQAMIQAANPGGQQISNAEKQKIKLNRFIDDVMNLKKTIPGVGNYKTEKGYSK